MNFIEQLTLWIGIFGGILGVATFFKLCYEHYFFKRRTRMGYLQELFRVYNTFSLVLRELEKTENKRSFMEEIFTAKKERWAILHNCLYDLDAEIYSKWLDVKNNLETKDSNDYLQALSHAVNEKVQYYEREYKKIIGEPYFKILKEIKNYRKGYSFIFSLTIASLIFIIAVCSDFAVRMFYTSEIFWLKVVTSLIAVLFIGFLIHIMLIFPFFRKALLRMFGVEEEKA